MDKQFRVDFMHSNGTLATETVTAILPSWSYILISTSLINTFSLHAFSIHTQFLVEFLIVIIPLVLNFTVFSDYTALNLVLSSFVALILIHFNRNKFPSISTKHIAKNLDYRKAKVTNARAIVSILSVIAILAVDFRIFPRRFAKTDSYGYSLMDTGVGLYITSSGIVHRPVPLPILLRQTVPLLILGIGRELFVSFSNYTVPITEYGQSWNFFLTLFVVKFLGGLLLNTVPLSHIWVNAILLLISHEVLLQMGLANFAIGNWKRTNFITANREGLTSIVGFTSLHLFSVYMGHLLNFRNVKIQSPFRDFKLMLFLVIVLMLCTNILVNYLGISRKLANASFCTWMLFLTVLVIFLFATIELYGSHFLKINLSESPVIVKAVNYNHLIFFLLSNLLTGIINLSCNTLLMNSTKSLIIILIYMLINCGVVTILYKNSIHIR